MPGDKASSRDSAVIDDDLVEALGFEPLSTIRADKGDASADDDVALGEASSSDSGADGNAVSARQGVVILGDVTPVEAGDPVASDIAAAILGDSSADDSDEVLDTSDGDSADDSDDVDEELLDLADFDDDDLDDDTSFVLFDADKNDGQDDEDTKSLFDADKNDGQDDEDTKSLFGDREDGGPGVLLDEILADDSEEDSDEDSHDADAAGDLTAADNLVEADEQDDLAEFSDSDLVDEAIIATGDDNEKVDLEEVNADGFGPGIFEKGFDPQETASAFPEVPNVGGSERIAAELDNRDLHTRSVELDQEDLVSADDDVLSLDVGADPSEPLPDTDLALAPVGVAPTKAGYRPKRIRAKKTRRVIRHIDPWSVLTFSVLFHLALYAAFLLASVLVWKTLEASGMVENIEDFIIALGDYETYQINADVLFRAGVIIAGILTVASTILSVLLSVVFNLISDLVGGIRVTVLEEETVRLPSKKSAAKSR